MNGPSSSSSAGASSALPPARPDDIAEPAARPLVTFILLAYRQQELVRAAVESALAQTYEPLEILISDDCSDDGTYAVIESVVRDYRGPHQVRCFRNPVNLGLAAHVNLLNERARGELIVAAAGDDVSLPERTTLLVEAFVAGKGRRHSIHSAVTRMDMAGRTLGLARPPLQRTPADAADIALSDALVVGASHAWSRRVVEVFGPITCPLAYEDLVIAFRSALLGEVHYIDRALVRYRVGNGLSTRSWRQLPDRRQRRTFLLRTVAMEVDVLRQRRLDCLRVGRADIVPAIDAAIVVRQLAGRIYEGSEGLLPLLVLCIRHGWLVRLAKPLLLRAFGRA